MVKRMDTLKLVSIIHAALWGPLVLLALFTEFGALKTLTALYIEHIEANANGIVYLYCVWILTDLAFTYGGSTNWLITVGYAFYAWWFNSDETSYGTFAMYYLNPEDDRLDASLYPSLAYLVGWRDHRYRYYHYFQSEELPNENLELAQDDDE